MALLSASVISNTLRRQALSFRRVDPDQGAVKVYETALRKSERDFRYRHWRGSVVERFAVTDAAAAPSQEGTKPCADDGIWL